MSFEMKSKDVVVNSDQALACLDVWSQHIHETGTGEMTVVRDGELVKIKIVAKEKKVEAEISNITIHHTYKYIHEICSFGYPEISKHYKATISGKDESNKLVQLSLYVNHSCEDGKTWDKSLSFHKV